ncbi:hypothetical protein [Microbacterium sp. USHLN186]|uniref:hypothetical protein n=1 Tax=Microbacterium sp. USHLN186 TaxID=3081286 RepID=UPI00301ACEAD
MSVGDHIKAASEGASHLSQRVVDANDAEHRQEADKAAADAEEQDAAEHWADDGGNESRPVDRSDREKRWAKATGRHWHPYEATPETQERAADEGWSRPLKPDHIPSQAPDDRS